MITIVTSGGVGQECGEDQIIMEESIIQDHGHEAGKSDKLKKKNKNKMLRFLYVDYVEVDSG